MDVTVCADPQLVRGDKVIILLQGAYSCTLLRQPCLWTGYIKPL